MGTRLEFNHQHHIEVEEDLAETEALLLTAQPSPFAAIALTRNGRRVLANAAQVRSVKGGPGHEAAVFDQA
jgi:hypothetical protein